MARKEVQTWETEKAPFPSRLSEIMKERKVSQEKLAQALGVKRQTVSLYKTGQSSPNVEQLYKIAQFFDVSSDWLVGLTNVKSRDIDLNAVCIKTGLSESAAETLIEDREKNDLALLFINNLLCEGILFQSQARIAAHYLVQAEISNQSKSKTQQLVDNYLAYSGAASGLFGGEVNSTVEIPAEVAGEFFLSKAETEIKDIVTKTVDEYKNNLKSLYIGLRNIPEEIKEREEIIRKAGIIAAISALKKIGISVEAENPCKEEL